MLISAVARSTDMAQGAAFLVWLTLLLFLDLILLGVMIQGKVAPEVAVTVALANPLQVFRTAALALFDPQLIVLGPSAYVILDLFGATGYKIFALGLSGHRRRRGGDAWLSPVPSWRPALIKSDRAIAAALVAAARGSALADDFPPAEPLFAATLSDLADKPVALAIYKGKPLIVNFWARWCGPCREEIPELSKARAKYKARGLEVIGIAIEENAEPVREFAKAYDIDYPVVLAKSKGLWLMQTLGNGRAGLPFTVAIDRKGNIVCEETRWHEEGRYRSRRRGGPEVRRRTLMPQPLEPTLAALPNPALRYFVATRPAFLSVTFVGCLLGLASAAASGIRLDPALATLTLFFALVAHAGANVINDYYDALSGCDGANTERVFPFTGGSRFIQNGVLSLRATGVFGYALLAAVVPAGLYLTAVSDRRPGVDRPGRADRRLGLFGAAAEAAEPRPGRVRHHRRLAAGRRRQRLRAAPWLLLRPGRGRPRLCPAGGQRALHQPVSRRQGRCPGRQAHGGGAPRRAARALGLCPARAADLRLGRRHGRRRPAA